MTFIKATRTCGIPSIYTGHASRFPLSLRFPGQNTCILVCNSPSLAPKCRVKRVVMSQVVHINIEEGKGKENLKCSNNCDADSIVGEESHRANYLKRSLTAFKKVMGHAPNWI